MIGGDIVMDGCFLLLLLIFILFLLFLFLVL